MGSKPKVFHKIHARCGKLNPVMADSQLGLPEITVA